MNCVNYFHFPYKHCTKKSTSPTLPITCQREFFYQKRMLQIGKTLYVKKTAKCVNGQRLKFHTIYLSYKKISQLQNRLVGFETVRRLRIRP